MMTALLVATALYVQPAQYGPPPRPAPDMPIVIPQPRPKCGYIRPGVWYCPQ